MKFKITKGMIENIRKSNRHEKRYTMAKDKVDKLTMRLEAAKKVMEKEAEKTVKFRCRAVPVLLDPSEVDYSNVIGYKFGKGRKPLCVIWKNKVYALRHLCSNVFNLNYGTVYSRIAVEPRWDMLRALGVDSHKIDHWLEENVELMRK